MQSNGFYYTSELRNIDCNVASLQLSGEQNIRFDCACHLSIKIKSIVLLHYIIKKYCSHNN